MELEEQILTNFRAHIDLLSIVHIPVSKVVAVTVEDQSAVLKLVVMQYSE